MDFGKKKKKKKSKPFNMDELKDSLGDAEDNETPLDDITTNTVNMDELDFDFSKRKKRPKKVKPSGIDDLLSEDKTKEGQNGKENGQ